MEKEGHGGFYIFTDLSATHRQLTHTHALESNQNLYHCQPRIRPALRPRGWPRVAARWRARLDLTLLLMSLKITY